MRIAVIDYELCRPSKCNRECITFCPINKTGGKAIEFDPGRRRPVIYEETCIGCGICVKKCPFKAISIVNLPDEMERRLIHRYGVNGFKLYGLPVPRRGQVLGILGRNATGKTTAIRILAGELRPNLGIVDRQPDWDEVIRRFRGTELQNYLKLLADGGIRAAHKIQYIDLVPRRIKGTVRELLQRADERGIWRDVAKDLGLENSLDKSIAEISGGELQRFMIAAVLCRQANLYVFDEPGSYLDVRERIRAAKAIRSYTPKDAFLVVVEHDLAMLDYLSDNVVIMYGEPGVWGAASKPYGVGAGINNFLKGYLPAENMRIRSEPIKYGITAPAAQEQEAGTPLVKWTRLRVELGGFQLEVEPGELREGEVVGVLGPNATGKTTFVRVLAGELKPAEGGVERTRGGLRVSYKPQRVSPELIGPEERVGDLLRRAGARPGTWIYSELALRLGLVKLSERRVKELSGGELQRLAVALTLAREADVYLLDEPSAFLDVEERLTVAKAVKRIAEARAASALVVEHDLAVADYIASRVMVFTGEPGVKGHADPPEAPSEAFNKFLRWIGVTVRKDPETGRPRINKEGSWLDRLQRRKGRYYA